MRTRDLLLMFLLPGVTVFFAWDSLGALLFLDEYHSVWFLHLPWTELLQHFGHGAGLLFPLLQKISINISTSGGTWVLRLPAFLGTMAAIMLFYVGTADRFGRRVAFMASLGVA